MAIQNSPQKARKRPAKTPSEKGLAMASRLQNRLLRFIMADAFSEPPPAVEGQKPVKSVLMTGEQVHATLGLLKKYMPDLKAIEYSGNAEHPVVHEIRRVIVDPANPADRESVPAPAEPE